MDQITKLFEKVHERIDKLIDRVKRLEKIPIKTFTAGHILFGGSDELPTSEAAFTYNSTTDTLTIPNITVQAWQTPTLLNSWVNFGSGFSDATYFKDPFGVVHIRGLVKNGTTTIGTPIFTLPTGYRPATECIFPVSSVGAYGECRISAIGEVKIFVGSNSWFSLEGITFRVA